MIKNSTTGWTLSERPDPDRRLTRALLTASLLLCLSVAVVLLTYLGVAGGLRLPVTLLFWLTAPGWALIAFFLPLSPAMEWTVATMLSITLSVAVSVVMLITGWWAPVGVTLAVAAVAGLMLTLHLAVMSQRGRFWVAIQRAPSP